MTPGVGEKRQPLSCQPKQRASSGAGKPWSRVHLTSDKGKLLIECISKKFPTEKNIERGEEVIRLKKEGTAEIKRAQKSNYWRGTREDKVTKR